MISIDNSPSQHLPRKTLDGRNSKWILYIFGPFLSLPPVPIDLFRYSLIASVMITTILSFFYSFIPSGTIQIRTLILDFFFTSILGDPLLWAGIICLLTSILILRTSRVIRGAENWSTIVSASLPFVVYLLIWVIGDLIVKPAFSVDRPPLRLHEPPLTTFVANLLGLGERHQLPNSMPSGNVMRQVAVFYFLNWIIFSRKSNNILSSSTKLILFFTNLFALLLVCVSRVYISSHTFLDVSVAIGVGTIIFWILTMPLYSLITVRGRSVNRIYLSSIMIATMLLFMVVFGFAGDFAALARLVIYCIILLGFVYLISPLVKLTNIKWVKR